LRAIYPVKCEQRFGVHYTDVSEQPTSTVSSLFLVSTSIYLKLHNANTLAYRCIIMCINIIIICGLLYSISVRILIQNMRLTLLSVKHKCTNYTCTYNSLYCLLLLFGYHIGFGDYSNCRLCLIWVHNDCRSLLFEMEQLSFEHGYRVG